MNRRRLLIFLVFFTLVAFLGSAQLSITSATDRKQKEQAAADLEEGTGEKSGQETTAREGTDAEQSTREAPGRDQPLREQVTREEPQREEVTQEEPVFEERTVEEWADFLDHPYPEIRARSAGLLSEIGAPAEDALPKLRKACDDPDPRVQEQAKRAIEKIKADVQRRATEAAAEPALAHQIPIGETREVVKPPEGRIYYLDGIHEVSEDGVRLKSTRVKGYGKTRANFFRLFNFAHMGLHGLEYVDLKEAYRYRQNAINRNVPNANELSLTALWESDMPKDVAGQWDFVRKYHVFHEYNKDYVVRITCNGQTLYHYVRRAPRSWADYAYGDHIAMVPGSYPVHISVFTMEGFRLDFQHVFEFSTEPDGLEVQYTREAKSIGEPEDMSADLRKELAKPLDRSSRDAVAERARLMHGLANHLVWSARRILEYRAATASEILPFLSEALKWREAGIEMDPEQYYARSLAEMIEVCSMVNDMRAYPIALRAMSMLDAIAAKSSPPVDEEYADGACAYQHKSRVILGDFVLKVANDLEGFWQHYEQAYQYGMKIVGSWEKVNMDETRNRWPLRNWWRSEWDDLPELAGPTGQEQMRERKGEEEVTPEPPTTKELIAKQAEEFFKRLNELDEQAAADLRWLKSIGDSLAAADKKRQEAQIQLRIMHDAARLIQNDINKLTNLLAKATKDPSEHWVESLYRWFAENEVQYLEGRSPKTGRDLREIFNDRIVRLRQELAEIRREQDKLIEESLEAYKNLIAELKAKGDKSGFEEIRKTARLGIEHIGSQLDLAELALYLSSGQGKRFQEAAGKCLAENRFHDEVRLMQAAHLLDVGRHRAAMQAARAILKRNPQHLEAGRFERKMEIAYLEAINNKAMGEAGQARALCRERLRSHGNPGWIGVVKDLLTTGVGESMLAIGDDMGMRYKEHGTGFIGSAQVMIDTVTGEPVPGGGKHMAVADITGDVQEQAAAQQIGIMLILRLRDPKWMPRGTTMLDWEKARRRAEGDLSDDELIKLAPEQEYEYRRQRGQLTPLELEKLSQNELAEYRKLDYEYRKRTAQLTQDEFNKLSENELVQYRMRQGLTLAEIRDLSHEELAECVKLNFGQEISREDSIRMRHAIRLAFNNPDIKRLADKTTQVFDLEAGRMYDDESTPVKGADIWEQIEEDLLDVVNVANVLIYVGPNAVIRAGGKAAGAGYWAVGKAPNNLITVKQAFANAIGMQKAVTALSRTESGNKLIHQFAAFHGRDAVGRLDKVIQWLSHRSLDMGVQIMASQAARLGAGWVAGKMGADKYQQEGAERVAELFADIITSMGVGDYDVTAELATRHVDVQTVNAAVRKSLKSAQETLALADTYKKCFDSASQELESVGRLSRHVREALDNSLKEVRERMFELAKQLEAGNGNLDMLKKYRVLETTYQSLRAARNATPRSLKVMTQMMGEVQGELQADCRRLLAQADACDRLAKQMSTQPEVAGESASAADASSGAEPVGETIRPGRGARQAADAAGASEGTIRKGTCPEGVAAEGGTAAAAPDGGDPGDGVPEGYRPGLVKRADDLRLNEKFDEAYEAYNEAIVAWRQWGLDVKNSKEFAQIFEKRQLAANLAMAKARLDADAAKPDLNIGYDKSITPDEVAGVQEAMRNARVQNGVVVGQVVVSPSGKHYKVMEQASGMSKAMIIAEVDPKTGDVIRRAFVVKPNMDGYRYQDIAEEVLAKGAKSVGINAPAAKGGVVCEFPDGTEKNAALVRIVEGQELASIDDPATRLVLKKDVAPDLGWRLVSGDPDGHAGNLLRAENGKCLAYDRNMHDMLGDRMQKMLRDELAEELPDLSADELDEAAKKQMQRLLNDPEALRAKALAQMKKDLRIMAENREIGYQQANKPGIDDAVKRNWQRRAELYGVMDRMQKEITREEMLDVAKAINEKYGSRDAVEALIGDRFSADDTDRVIKLFEARRDCLEKIAEEFPSVGPPPVNSPQVQAAPVVGLERGILWPFLTQPRLAA